MKKKSIILGITGSIAAYKACDLVGLLRKKGHDVTCVLTRSGLEFVTRLTLETLSQNKAHNDMFALPEKRDVIHVSLAQKADLIIICPATADIIGKLASGICDDLLTSVVISARCPVIIAPAMNDNMYNHKITRKNIAELKKIGYKFIGPAAGRLACGYTGVGHLADLSVIVKAIENNLK